MENMGITENDILPNQDIKMKVENEVDLPSYLLEALLRLFTSSLDSELCTEDVAKLGTVSISSTWRTFIELGTDWTLN